MRGLTALACMQGNSGRAWAATLRGASPPGGWAGLALCREGVATQRDDVVQRGRENGVGARAASPAPSLDAQHDLAGRAAVGAVAELAGAACARGGGRAEAQVDSGKWA